MPKLCQWAVLHSGTWFLTSPLSSPLQGECTLVGKLPNFRTGWSLRNLSKLMPTLPHFINKQTQRNNGTCSRSHSKVVTYWGGKPRPRSSCPGYLFTSTNASPLRDQGATVLPPPPAPVESSSDQLVTICPGSREGPARTVSGPSPGCSHLEDFLSPAVTPPSPSCPKLRAPSCQVKRGRKKG